MGCVTSLHSKNHREIYPRVSSFVYKKVSLPVSRDKKDFLRESWKLLEEEKDRMGKTIFIRLLELNPDLQHTFPSFKGVALDELMNTRSLHLHSKRLMAAMENAVSSLDDGQDFIEYLMDLGERHIAISISEKHFKVMEKALVLTLQDILKDHCTEDIVNAWTELFGFISGTMLAGKERAQENRNSLI